MRKSELNIGVLNHSDLNETLERTRRNERLLEAKLAHQLERCQLLEEMVIELQEKLLNIEAADAGFKIENKTLKSQLAELEKETVQLNESLQLREEWVDQLRGKLQTYQKEVEDTQLEARERRMRVTALMEENRRLEHCLKQAVQGREKALLEVDYLKSELFDQRQKLLTAHLNNSRAS